MCQALFYFFVVVVILFFICFFQSGTVLDDRDMAVAY